MTRDLRLHRQVSSARSESMRSEARRRLTLLLKEEDIAELVAPTLEWFKENPRCDFDERVAPPWLGLGNKLLAADVRADWQSHHEDAQQVIFERLATSLADATRDDAGKWVLIGISATNDLNDHFLHALGPERIAAHFGTWSAECSRSMRDSVFVTGFRDDSADAASAWLDDRLKQGAGAVWSVERETERIRGHMLLKGAAAACSKIAAAATGAVFADWLRALPNNLLRHLAFDEVESVDLAIEILATPAVGESGWLFATAFATALDLVEKIDSTLRHGASGRWAAKEDDELVAKYKEELARWRTQELPAHATAFGNACAPSDTTILVLRELFVQHARGEDDENDAPRQVLRAAAGQALIRAGRAAEALDKLAALPLRPGGLTTCAVMIHSDDTLAEGAASIVSAFYRWLSLEKYIGAERGGDGELLYWLVAGLYEFFSEPDKAWLDLLNTLPTDAEGWHVPRGGERRREVERGAHLVTGAMAATWLRERKSAAQAEQLFKFVLDELVRWVRADSADDDFVRWVLAQVWARVPHCHGPRAEEIAMSFVDAYDTLDQIGVAFGTLEANMPERQLPPRVKHRIAERYEQMRGGWWLPPNHDQTLPDWFSRLAR